MSIAFFRTFSFEFGVCVCAVSENIESLNFCSRCVHLLSKYWKPFETHQTQLSMVGMFCARSPLSVFTVASMSNAVLFSSPISRFVFLFNPLLCFARAKNIFLRVCLNTNALGFRCYFVVSGLTHFRLFHNDAQVTPKKRIQTELRTELYAQLNRYLWMTLHDRGMTKNAAPERNEMNKKESPPHFFVSVDTIGCVYMRRLTGTTIRIIFSHYLLGARTKY